jgi:hypothetical protein
MAKEFRLHYQYNHNGDPRAPWYTVEHYILEEDIPSIARWPEDGYAGNKRNIQVLVRDGDEWVPIDLEQFRE